MSAGELVYDDKVQYLNGFGVRKVGSPGKVDVKTVFQLASLSKPVATTVVAGLVGKDVVTWEDPVIKHYPGFALHNAYTTENATLADMMAHRSGLPDHFGDLLESLGYDQAYILAHLRYAPLAPFRITYAYTNFGFTSAGLSAANAAGKTWPAVSESELYRPAGMTSTSSRFADFATSPDRAYGHVQTATGWAARYVRDPDAQSPAGGVSSSITDMSRWLRLQLAGGTLDSRRIIDETAPVVTHTPMWSGDVVRASQTAYLDVHRRLPCFDVFCLNLVAMATYGTTLRGSVCAGTAMVMVGSSAAVTPLITSYPILAGQAWRYLVAGLVLAVAHRPAAIRPQRPSRREWLRILVLAATGMAGFNVFLLLAVQRSAPATVGAVVGAAPVVLAIAGPLLAGGALSARIVVSAVLTVTGIGLIQFLDPGSVSGLLLAGGALVCECCFSLIAVPLLPSIGPRRLSAFACLAAAPMLASASACVEHGRALQVPTRTELLVFAYLALVVTAFAFFLWYRGIELLGVARAGLFAGVVPVVALLLGPVLGTGTISTSGAIGAGLVSVAVVYGVSAPRRNAGGPGTGSAPVNPSQPVPAPVLVPGHRPESDHRRSSGALHRSAWSRCPTAGRYATR